MKSAQLLDLDGVAKLLNIGRRQAQLLYHKGAFPGLRLSHKYLRFDPGEVLKAIKKGKTKCYDRTP